MKEYIQICRAVAIGFAIMGFIGYFVKLVSGSPNDYFTAVMVDVCLISDRTIACLPKSIYNYRSTSLLTVS